MRRFIKRSVLDEATLNAAKLFEINVLNKENTFRQRMWMLASLAKSFCRRLKPRKRQAPFKCWNSKKNVLFYCSNWQTSCWSVVLCSMQYSNISPAWILDTMAKNPVSSVSKCSSLLRQLISKKVVPLILVILFFSNIKLL